MYHVHPQRVLPDNEEERVAALRKYDILDTPPDGAFDRVTALAAELFSVPIAIVSLVDHDRIWFKSHHGLDVEQIDRTPGLCASAILQDVPYVVEDAKADARTLANPLVAGEFGLRFYAAVPLRTREGFSLGTLCVIDQEPRQTTADEIRKLEHLASIVMDQMELRLEARRSFSQSSALARESAVQAVKLVERERFINAVLNNASVAVFVMDDKQHCTFMNAAAERLTGFTLAEVAGRALHDVIHHQRPDGTHYPLQDCPIDRAFPERHRVQGEEVFVHKDGSFYPVAFTASPMEDEQGRPVGTIIEVRDIKSEKEAERALRESEARQRAITEATPECIKIVGPQGDLVHMNPAGLRMIEAPCLKSVRGADTFSLIAPEHRQLWKQNHKRVLDGESLSWEFDIVGLGGTRRRMETHAVPLAMPDGRIAQLAVTRDITERKRAEEHQRLLINELNHRVKNTLAVVQGIARQSFRGADIPPKARSAFEGRLAALSAAHGLLTNENWDSASIRQVVDDALAPFNGGQRRFQVSGPDIRLTPKTAVTLALAVHELATNAAKYGALSNQRGRVELKWWAQDNRLRLSWREVGGPPVSPPAARGFGTRMIERGLAAELRGKVTIEFAPGGIICEVDAPFPEQTRGAALEAAIAA